MKDQKSFEDLLFPERSYYKLVKDYQDGFISQRRIFYRAKVTAVGTDFGELESDPPSPPGSVRASVYTHALDANLPDYATNIFYPIGEVSSPPRVGEHVYVVFEDGERFSAGFWVSRVPNASILGPNNQNPDFQPEERSPTTADTFEGNTTTAQSEPSEEEVRARYTVSPLGQSQNQRQTVANFEEQGAEFWSGKKVLLIGDSQVASRQTTGPSVATRYMKQKLEEKNVGSFSYDGRTSWSIQAWNSGRTQARGNVIREAPPIDETIIRNNPDVLIIILGGNNSHNSRSQIQDAASTFWRKVQSTGIQNVIWAGPPAGYRDGELIPGRARVGRVIKTVVGDSTFYYDSHSKTERNPAGARGRLGVHFANNAAARSVVEPWIDSLIATITARFRRRRA